jgi:hypothetical protein
MMFVSCNNLVYETNELCCLQEITRYRCGFEEVIFLLPEFSTNLDYEFIKWNIHIEGIGYSSDFDYENNCFSLSVVKNEPLCVVAVPIFYEKSDINKKEHIFYKAAGAIYPYKSYSAGNSVFVEVEWESGFVADLMKSLYMENKDKNIITTSEFISSFNWKKLQIEIENKIDESIENLSSNVRSEKFYNPWLLDKEYLLKNISDGSFSVSYITLKNVVAVNIDDLKIINSNVESSFIPENEIINKFRKIVVKKKESCYFIAEDCVQLELNAITEKNVSHGYVSLPIYEK